MNYSRISFLLFTICLLNFSEIAAQCQNCTTLISSNQNNLTVSSGVVCIASGVTITGTISLSNGATLCNQGTLNISSMIVNTAQNANLINYGSISANSITWGTNATGSFDNYGTVLCNDLNLGYHYGYNVNFTNHPNANFTVNCSAYLLAGTFNFNGPATFNAPIYFSGAASTVNINFNSVFNCSNQINSGAGIANNITVANNATVNSYSWNITDDALFTNNGTVNISDAFLLQASSGENIVFNQNNNLRVRGSSSSTGLSISNVGGNLQFTNSGPTSVQNRFSIQGATLIMNGYNVFCNSLYVTSNASVTTSLNCGGRINVSGTSILQNSTFGNGVDFCDTGGSWDAMQGTFNGTLCSCNGIGTVGSYVNFPLTSNCPVQCSPTSSTLNHTACSSFTLNGQTYNASGNYTQVRTNTAGCDSTITMNLTIMPLPIITKSNDTTICAGSTVNLLASGGQNFVWSPAGSLSNATIANPVASPQTNTTYSVTVTGQNGCSATAQVSVLVNSNPTVNASSATICQGQSTTLNALGASNYSWSPAIGLSSTVGATVIANPTKTRFYQVIGTDQNGCSGIANVTVTVISRPYVNLGRDLFVCRGTPVSLDAGINGTIYQWNTGQTTQTINVSASGTYAVTVSTQNGCTGRDTVNVTFQRCRYSPPTIIPIKSGDLSTNPKNIDHPIQIKAIKIYPNPADDFLMIEHESLEENDFYSIRIYNQLGQRVFDQVIRDRKYQIELNDWAVPGMYYVDVMDSNGELLDQQKIVVE
jgi:hypothetical protein